MTKIQKIPEGGFNNDNPQNTANIQKINSGQSNSNSVYSAPANNNYEQSTQSHTGSMNYDMSAKAISRKRAPANYTLPPKKNVTIKPVPTEDTVVKDIPVQPQAMEPKPLVDTKNDQECREISQNINYNQEESSRIPSRQRNKNPVQMIVVPKEEKISLLQKIKMWFSNLFKQGKNKKNNSIPDNQNHYPTANDSVAQSVSNPSPSPAQQMPYSNVPVQPKPDDTPPPVQQTVDTSYSSRNSVRRPSTADDTPPPVQQTVDTSYSSRNFVRRPSTTDNPPPPAPQTIDTSYSSRNSVRRPRTPDNIPNPSYNQSKPDHPSPAQYHHKNSNTNFSTKSPRTPGLQKITDADAPQPSETQPKQMYTKNDSSDDADNGYSINIEY